MSLSLFGESEKARSQKKKPHAACETTTTEKKRVRSMREIIKIARAAFAWKVFLALSQNIFTKIRARAHVKPLPLCIRRRRRLLHLKGRRSRFC